MQSACFDKSVWQGAGRARGRGRTPTFVSEREGGPPRQGSCSEKPGEEPLDRGLLLLGQLEHQARAGGRWQRQSQGVSQTRSCRGYLGDDGLCRVPDWRISFSVCPPAEGVKTSLQLLSLSLTSTHFSKLNCLVFDIFLTTYLDLNTFSVKTVCTQCVLHHR